MKIADTKTLKVLAKQAVAYKFNRGVTDEYLRRLDPDGLHVINIVLALHNGDFAEIAHHRCTVLSKFKGSDEPVEVYLDIAVRDYDQLGTIADIKWKDAVTQ